MSSRKMTILLAGGGTGGHLFPGIALAQELRDREEHVDIMFATGNKQIEHTILEGYSFPVKRIATRKWTTGVIKYPLMAFSVLISWIRSCIFIIRKRVHTVIGLGGYSSFGPVLAAFTLRRSIYLLEQNAIPGRTNRVLSRFADGVFTQFASSEDYFRSAAVKQLGNPVRKEIELLEQVAEDQFTLLVTGGSQGAHALNEMFIRAAEHIQFPQKSRIVHLCGRDHYEQCGRWYAEIKIQADIELVAFMENMDDVYQHTSLAVCRAGATSIAEMTCIGIPMIMIPFPFATDDHQFYNAQEVVKEGGGICMRQEEISSEKLAETVNGLIQDKEKLDRMREGSRKAGRPEAARDIVECLIGHG